MNAFQQWCRLNIFMPKHPFGNLLPSRSNLAWSHHRKSVLKTARWRCVDLLAFARRHLGPCRRQERSEIDWSYWRQISVPERRRILGSPRAAMWNSSIHLSSEAGSGAARPNSRGDEKACRKQKFWQSSGYFDARM